MPDEGNDLFELNIPRSPSFALQLYGSHKRAAEFRAWQQTWLVRRMRAWSELSDRTGSVYYDIDLCYCIDSLVD